MLNVLSWFGFACLIFGVWIGVMLALFAAMDYMDGIDARRRKRADESAFTPFTVSAEGDDAVYDAMAPTVVAPVDSTIRDVVPPEEVVPLEEPEPALAPRRSPPFVFVSFYRD